MKMNALIVGGVDRSEATLRELLQVFWQKKLPLGRLTLVESASS